MAGRRQGEKGDNGQRGDKGDKAEAWTRSPEVRVRTPGSGSPKVVEPGPQLRFGPARDMNLNLNIGSGSCANLVQQVREPDHGQSTSEAPRMRKNRSLVG
jgi:hypothetical protein